MVGTNDGKTEVEGTTVGEILVVGIIEGVADGANDSEGCVVG